MTPPEQGQAAKPSYRPDIDGLRAVAVLLVVFNHLRTRFSGGYIGVDVFFVISGYLISGVILSEMNTGSFSIIRFYDRRIRRILPALIVMMLGTCILVFRYFVPPETESFARSMLAALFSVSNLLFWHEAGYFDAPSTLKPLLHTWSLAVEEQFYIVFPIFLLAVRRFFPQRLKEAVWTLTAITFALACIWVRRDPTAAFYFAPLRAWELLIGTIISQHYVPVLRSSIQRNFASLTGLLLVMVPALMYTPQTPFPGLAALPPCLGAALLIAGGETGTSLVGRVLSWRPIVFIGLISYSLYLWHWPILVFQNTSLLLLHAGAGDKRSKFAVLAVSLVAATLSWRFVETPFRKGRFRPGRRTLFILAGAAASVVTMLGISAIVEHGFSGRFPQDALAVAEYTSFDPTAAYRGGVCFMDSQNAFSDFRPQTCLAEDPARKHYLLLGDSHGAHLYPGLSAVFPELNLSQANAAGCVPLMPDATPTSSTRENGCLQMRRFIYKDYLPHHSIDTVLLAARWSDSDIPALGQTISWIKQQKAQVILLGPIIEFDVPLPRLLAISLREHAPSLLEQHRLKDPEQLDKRLADMARRWGVPYISAYKNLCAATEATSPGDSPCPVYASPGVPLLWDTDHFTPQGSILYARTMKARKQLP